MAQPPTPHTYEIRIGSRIDEGTRSWFDGIPITSRGDETVLQAVVTDQSALHGLLARIRDLGVPLIEVRRVDQVVAGEVHTTEPTRREE